MIAVGCGLVFCTSRDHRGRDAICSVNLGVIVAELRLGRTITTTLDIVRGAASRSAAGEGGGGAGEGQGGLRPGSDERPPPHSTIGLARKVLGGSPPTAGCSWRHRQVMAIGFIEMAHRGTLKVIVETSRRPPLAGRG